MISLILSIFVFIITIPIKAMKVLSATKNIKNRLVFRGKLAKSRFKNDLRRHKSNVGFIKNSIRRVKKSNNKKQELKSVAKGAGRRLKYSSKVRKDRRRENKRIRKSYREEDKKKIKKHKEELKKNKKYLRNDLNRIKRTSGSNKEYTDDEFKIIKDASRLVLKATLMAINMFIFAIRCIIVVVNIFMLIVSIMISCVTIAPVAVIGGAVAAYVAISDGDFDLGDLTSSTESEESSSSFTTSTSTGGNQMQKLEEMAKWYENNVRTYLGAPGGARLGYTCPLTQGYYDTVYDDCSSFATAYMNYVSEQNLFGSTPNTAGLVSYTDFDKGGWKYHKSSELNSIDDLPDGSVVVVNNGSQHHAEIFVDKGHTFGWGSVKQPGYYPHAVTWTLSTEQNGVKLISGKYTCFYSYSGD